MATEHSGDKHQPVGKCKDEYQLVGSEISKVLHQVSIALKGFLHLTPYLACESRFPISS